MKNYVMNIINDGGTINFAEVNFVTYAAPKLVLCLNLKDEDKIPSLRAHVLEQTVLRLQLEYRREAIRRSSISLSGLKQTMSYGKDELWISPTFRAQVTATGEQPLQFELTVLDNVDLSGLN